MVAHWRSEAGIGGIAMNVHEDSIATSNETAARVIAYLGPYLFWGTVGGICVAVLLLQGG